MACRSRLFGKFESKKISLEAQEAKEAQKESILNEVDEAIKGRGPNPVAVGEHTQRLQNNPAPAGGPGNSIG